VVTARAKGLRPLKLLFKYPLRMALNPFISDIGSLLPHVISGVGWGSVSGYVAAGVPMLQPGETFTHTFTTAGLYPYACYLHPGMSGVVIVGDSDAAATSATTAQSPSGPTAPASAEAPPSSDTPWSYLLIALFGVIAIGGYGIALARRF